MATEAPAGLRLWPEAIDPTGQRALLQEILALLAAAPPFRPTMPRDGKPFSVTMSNAGPLGWVADRAGYRYQPLHPESGRPWPAIPPLLLSLWQAHSGYRAPPEACLINLYDAGARMGLHRDADEAALDAPVLSLSLGDSALFRLGGPRRRDPTRSFRLASGDLLRLGGAARHCHHGIDRVIAGSSRLLDDVPALAARRINLTLRRVTAP